jgi:hypothetical protein
VFNDRPMGDLQGGPHWLGGKMFVAGFARSEIQ